MRRVRNRCSGFAPEYARARERAVAAADMMSMFIASIVVHAATMFDVDAYSSRQFAYATPPQRF